MIRVLIVDDEIEKAQPLISYFREICEWIAEIADGPDQALEQFLPVGDACPFDVIVLDVMMEPGKMIPREATKAGRATGLELLELIAKRYACGVKFIVYTARTDLEINDDRRIAAYFQKPSEPRDIVRAIQQLVEAT